jgi:hypothetical protein
VSLPWWRALAKRMLGLSRVTRRSRPVSGCASADGA